MITRQFVLELKKDGTVFDESAANNLLGNLGDLTDLVILVHGWNNNMPDAAHLYDQLLQSVSTVSPNLPGVDQRHLGVLRVFWPSKRFDDSDLLPGGGAASAATQNNEALLRALRELRHDPERLGGTDVDSARAANVDQAMSLVDRLDGSEAARQEFVLRIRAILNPDEAHEEDGSREFFEREPEALFDRFGEAVPVPLQVGEGGAADIGDSGGAAFLGDLLDGAGAAARRIVNYATYYQMKSRAGVVGRGGLATTLVRARDRKSDLALHLVGHSFGGRAVTAAASALPPHGSAITLTLLQAAFSHNGLAQQFDGEHDGAFRTVVADERVSGPIIITHTKNDLAVGVAYPLASRIARDMSAALGDAEDPYGGMGRNGAQHTPEVATEETRLLDPATQSTYTFAHHKVFNLNADGLIKGHGDITGTPVANALLQAVLAS